MRIYTNAAEAFEEIKRDLAEMGIVVRPKSMQNKNIEGNPDYETRELQNYSYTLLNADSSQIPGVIQPWADAEFMERVIDPSDFTNPGKAWKLRPEVWNEFLVTGDLDQQKMDYTYNERLHIEDQINKVITRLLVDPDSRQLWISLWDPNLDPGRIGGTQRVPCSLGYNLQVREGKLNLHYVMRSCDFATHFPNDVYLAIRLQEYISKQTGYEIGDFTHTMFSLHVYQKDVVNVF